MSDWRPIFSSRGTAKRHWRPKGTVSPVWSLTKINAVLMLTSRLHSAERWTKNIFQEPGHLPVKTPSSEAADTDQERGGNGIPSGTSHDLMVYVAPLHTSPNSCAKKIFHAKISLAWLHTCLTLSQLYRTTTITLLNLRFSCRDSEHIGNHSMSICENMSKSLTNLKLVTLLSLYLRVRHYNQQNIQNVSQKE